MKTAVHSNFAPCYPTPQELQPSQERVNQSIEPITKLLWITPPTAMSLITEKGMGVEDAIARYKNVDNL